MRFILKGWGKRERYEYDSLAHLLNYLGDSRFIKAVWAEDEQLVVEQGGRQRHHFVYRSRTGRDLAAVSAASVRRIVKSI